MSLLITIFPICFASPVLPTPEALGKAYGLYRFDRDNLLNRLSKTTKHLIEWDKTYTLENAAGIAASCEMIDYDIYSWPWTVLKTEQIQSQLNHYTHGRGASGIFGFVKSSTLLAPWEEWRDLKRIVHQWEKSPEYSGEHKALKLTEKIGCSVIPGCVHNQEYYTVLVCLLSPKMNMVPASDEVELDSQPPIGLSGPIPGESPLTSVEKQDGIPIEGALLQPDEKQKSAEIPPPGPSHVVLEKQDYMPEELYDKLSSQLGSERSQLQNDYPNSQELELDPQPEFIWRRI